MRDTLKRWVVKWAGTAVGALAGALATWGLPLPADWETQQTLALAGLLMAVFTKAADWIVGKLPIDLGGQHATP